MKMGAAIVNLCCSRIKQEGQALVGTRDDESEEVDYSTSDSKGKPRRERELLETEELGAKSLFTKAHEQQAVRDYVIKSPPIQYNRRGNCRQAGSTSKEAVVGGRNNGEKWDAMKAFLEEMNLALVRMSSINESGRLG